MIAPTLTTAPLLFECPDWCTTQHDVNEGLFAWHDGPPSGGFVPGVVVGDPCGVAGRELRATVDLQHYIPRPIDCDDGFTADELRSLAADALAAAEWLQANASDHQSATVETDHNQER